MAADAALAAAYLPHFRKDRLEPFDIQAVGYTVMRARAASPSCGRVLDPGAGAAVIEYEVFFDFDIQHLYDLEHVFVYVSDDGRVTDVEASFHGWFFRSMFSGMPDFEDETHPVIYMQPGKHAMMPNPELFRLYRELFEACGPLAGAGGFLVAPMFEGRLSTAPEFDRAVREYITEKYAFVPSMEFVPACARVKDPMTFGQLDDYIVERMLMWKDKISKAKIEAKDGQKYQHSHL